jgi:hypothetical protein
MRLALCFFLHDAGATAIGPEGHVSDVAGESRVAVVAHPAL